MLYKGLFQSGQGILQYFIRGHDIISGTSLEWVWRVHAHPMRFGNKLNLIEIGAFSFKLCNPYSYIQ